MLAILLYMLPSSCKYEQNTAALNSSGRCSESVFCSVYHAKRESTSRKQQCLVSSQIAYLMKLCFQSAPQGPEYIRVEHMIQAEHEQV
jgi:hypothetical protein